MPKFKFKFDTVKKVKNAFEKKAQKELQIIDLEIRRVTGLIDMFEQEIECHKAAVTSKVNLKVSELKYLTDYENYIQEKIKAARIRLQRLEKEKNNKINELIRRSKESKIFEKLEVKHLNKFNINSKRIEQNEIDDIAGKRSQRGNTN